MFCCDTHPCFSITRSRTPITTNASNQFFESIYIAGLLPTDNFHLIHPPYIFQSMKMEVQNFSQIYLLDIYIAKCKIYF